jgi:predicted phosphoribosyltransferase
MKKKSRPKPTHEEIARCACLIYESRRRKVARCVVGVPVSSPETCAEFRAEVDEIVCVITPEEFRAVGQFYEDFSQTTDEEVRELLASAAGGGDGS